jgi:glycogen operon protein
VNFALYSRNATRVELHLFDRPEDAVPAAVIPLDQRTRFVWHVHVSGIRAGQAYGFRVHGPYDPGKGHRFNPAKLLLDPYAKAVSGKYDWSRGRHLGYDPGSAFKDLDPDSGDNAAGAPKSLVVDDAAFDWKGDSPPGIPFDELLVYEVHVKGFTAHPSSGVSRPGTYLGFIEKIPHLVRLGVNAVELLPIHECHVDGYLLDKGLTNYWGYGTIGFFAPDCRYAAGRDPGAAVPEFKAMVKALHAAGIEVILDVVYNHTAEGNHLGPTLSFKGVDNATYYCLTEPDRRYYRDYTGCGNTLNLDDPQGVRLVMDSLRYWVEAMHVDGFRFDLATALGRERGRFEQVSAFFMAVHQDPILSRVKLIAEPWDLGADSYQVGNFPVEWSEWNGRFRDCTRRFVKSGAGLIPEVACRLTGSSDLYGDDGRTPYHSVNFITCHDGFTLHDLWSYDGKHNDANGEDNRDGANDNDSWNCGAEGRTDEPGVVALRQRLARNSLAMLLLSQGTPMLLGGDEFLRTQGGNNNAYCQDNPISWFDWTLAGPNAGFSEFCRKLIALRKRHPGLRRKTFFTGEDLDRDSFRDINWYDENLRAPDWRNPEVRHLAFYVQGTEARLATGREERDLFVILNSHWDAKSFALPRLQTGLAWHRVLDTSLPAGQDIVDEEAAPRVVPEDRYLANGRSIVVLVGKPV